MLGRKELTKGTKLRVVTAVVIPTLDSKGKAQGENTGYADESVVMNRGGVKIS